MLSANIPQLVCDSEPASSASKEACHLTSHAVHSHLLNHVMTGMIALGTATAWSALSLQLEHQLMSGRLDKPSWLQSVLGVAE